MAVELAVGFSPYEGPISLSVGIDALRIAFISPLLAKSLAASRFLTKSTAIQRPTRKARSEPTLHNVLAFDKKCVVWNSWKIGHAPMSSNISDHLVPTPRSYPRQPRSTLVPGRGAARLAT